MQDFMRLFSWMKFAKKDIFLFTLREGYIAATIASSSVILTYITLALQKGDVHLLERALVLYGLFMLMATIIRLMSHRYMLQTVKHRLDTLVRDSTMLRQVLKSHPHDVEFYGT